MSLAMCGGFLMMTVCYFTASMFLFGPDFQTTTYALVGLASLATGLAMTWVAWRAPEYAAPSTLARSEPGSGRLIAM